MKSSYSRQKRRIQAKQKDVNNHLAWNPIEFSETILDEEDRIFTI